METAQVLMLGSQWLNLNLITVEFWEIHLISLGSVSIVIKTCVTLCNPMDCSIPGSSVLHYLPEFAQIHVHLVTDAIQPSHPLSPPSPPVLNLSQHQDLFQWAGSSHQVAKVLKLQHQSFQWIFRVDSFRIDWFDLLAVPGTLGSLLQHNSSKASILGAETLCKVGLYYTVDPSSSFLILYYAVFSSTVLITSVSISFLCMCTVPLLSLEHECHILSDLSDMLSCVFSISHTMPGTRQLYYLSKLNRGQVPAERNFGPGWT